MKGLGQDPWSEKRGFRPSLEKSNIMPKVNHIVLLAFKEQDPKAIGDLFAELAGLKELVPGLLSFQGGPYSSPEGLHKGFTHAFTMIFADESARDAYLPHPEHERVKNLLLPVIDDVIAFDFLLPEGA